MPSERYREEDPGNGTSIAVVLLGAIAGFAVGMYVAQRMGGFGGLMRRIKKSAVALDRDVALFEAAGDGFLEEDFDADLDAELEGEPDEDVDEPDEELDEAAPADTDGPVLEERVLEAFTNDPILSERAIDIGANRGGEIELEGWVDDDSEAELAVTIARGVPGVRSVANHLMVDD